MKVRSLFASVIAVGLAAHLSAKIEFISVEKLADHVQTDTGTVTLKTFIAPLAMGQPPVSVPYQFRVHVEGTDLGALATPTFAAPAGSSYLNGTDPILGQMVYNASGDEWGRTFYYGSKYSATGGPPGGAGPGGIDGLFNNGAYTLTVDSTAVNLNLGAAANADIYPNVPVATLSAGTWAGGGVNTLYLNTDQALTISTSTFTDFYTNGYLSHIGLFICNNGSDFVELESFSDNTLFPGELTTDSLSTTLNAFSLTGGQSYLVEIEFNVVVDTSDELSGVLGVALFTSRTQFYIQAVSAVPEPATYAAILGAVALVGVMVTRRRRLV